MAQIAQQDNLFFDVTTLGTFTEDQKKIYYKELYPHGVPIELDVGKEKLMFKCSKCDYYNNTDNQLIVHKKQKLLRRKIIDE